MTSDTLKDLLEDWAERLRSQRQVVAMTRAEAFSPHDINLNIEKGILNGMEMFYGELLAVVHQSSKKQETAE